MNILIVANHYPVCSARYAADAFKRLGHDVRHIGPDMGREIWGLTLPAEYAWKPDHHLAEYSELSRINPDLTIVMDSDPAILDWAGKAPYFAPPNIVWGVDNHVRRYERECFDHYFLAHKGVSIQPYDDKTTHLPCAYDPAWFTPSPIPFAEREYDVCCLGVMYPKRVELVDAMKAAGLKVIAGAGLVYSAYRDIHHNSRIALCSSAAGDVAQRVFESAAMGSVVLTDECADFKLLQPDGLAYYTSVQGAVDMATRLIHESEFAQICIERSRAWVMGHSWDARADVIVKWWEANYGAS